MNAHARVQRMKIVHAKECIHRVVQVHERSINHVQEAYSVLHMRRSKECVIVFHHIFISSRIEAHTHGLWDKHQQKSDCIKSTYVAAHVRYSVYNAMNLHYLNSLVLNWGKWNFEENFSEERKVRIVRHSSFCLSREMI